MRIEQLEEFSVIGQSTELTNRQLANIQIGKEFWPIFNSNLKKNYLSLHGNWTKYAFTYKNGDKIYYYCAIPKPAYVPDTFMEWNIPSKTYMVFEHVGAMDTMNKTYNKIYKEVLPESEYEADKSLFFHFERYDKRFYWNRSDSVIEIWVPVVCKVNE